MNAAKRVAKNTLVVAIVQGVLPLFSFILVCLIARFLGASNLGKYSFLMAFFGTFLPIAVLGLNTLITREVAKDRTTANKYLTNAFIIGVLSSLLLMGVMCLLVNVIDYGPSIVVPTYVISFAVVFSTPIAYCEAVFRAFEQFEFIACGVAVQNITKVAFGLCCLLLGYGLLGVIVVVVVSSLIGLLVNIYFISRFITKLYFAVDFRFCKTLMRRALYFAGISMVASIYWKVDILMLGKLRNMEEVGFYSAAYRLLSICIVIPQCYTLATFPVMSRQFASSLSVFESTCKRSIRYLYIVILPIAGIVTLLSPSIITTIYGEKFIDGINALRILIWTIVPYSSVMVLARTILASGNEKIDFRINIIGILANIALNLILIPQMGYIGASIATVLSMCIFLVLQCLFISRNIFRIRFIYITSKPIIASFIAIMLILVFKQMDLVLLVLLSLSAYFLSLFALKTFTEEDRHLFRSLVGRKAMS